MPPLYHGKPRIWQLVPEKIWRHAGISFWRGATRINDTSIGIELENRGWQKSAGSKYFAPFEPAQIQALIPLAKDIIARYDIKPQNVVAHADVAPQRKDDPVRCFHGKNWLRKELARGRMLSGWRFILPGERPIHR